MTYSTEVQEDLNAAKYLLNRHGFAFKIWGAEDVRNRLEQHAEANPLHYGQIIDHIMKGDDWGTQSEETPADDSNIWALIDGTQHDHPEWFGTPEDELKEKAKDWMYRHGQAILDDMHEDIMEEQEVSQEDAERIIRLIENAQMTIEF